MSRGGSRGATPSGNYGPNFESIRKDFFIAAASFLSLVSGMSAGKNAVTNSAQWYVQGDHARRFSVHAAHAEHDDRRANSLALIITTSLLFVLLASAVMVGGHAVISPLLRTPAVTGNTHSRGDIVYTMPDGTFCQHMTFDNTTGRITIGGIDRCDPGLGGSSSSFSTGFKWGVH
jgi:hypothetical protein